MNVIIGADGYIGSFLSYKLQNTINVVNCNVTNENQITFNDFKKKWFNNEFKCCNIFIVASCENIQTIINVLKYNIHNNKFILFSSAVIYDGINKDEYEENDSIFFKSTDKYAKIIKENEESFINLGDCVKIILRCGTVYGFSPNFDATRGINRMIYSSIINNELFINNKNLKKSFVSLNEIYNIIQKLIVNEQLTKINIYNVSSFSLTLHDLANYLLKNLNVKINYYDSTKKEYEFYLSNKKLIEEYNYNNISSLETIENDIVKDFYDLNFIKYIDNNKIINIWTKLNYCRVCKSENIFEVLDLKTQPPPNRLSDVFYKFLSFPLKLNCCKECSHLQLEGFINPIIMFTNYTYLSGVTKTMNNYFESFVKSLPEKNKKVLDIACNDGCLLDYFKLEGYETYGIDPAENLLKNIKNHNVICGFFNKETVSKLQDKFDIITAFNVFAHLDNIYDFMDNIEKISDENTDIYIQTSQCDMIKNNEFDTIYHEHLSFFTLKSMTVFLSKTNFYLNDIKIVPVHGNSYLFHIKKQTESLKYNDSQSIRDRLKYEIDNRFYCIDTYKIYKQNIENWINQLIINLKKNNNKIIGVGASAKGITILNYIYAKLNENNIIIDCIIDENSLKINTIIDAVKLKIKSFKYIENIEESITFILFAWNFQKELKEKINRLRNNKNDKFVIPQIIE
jgi:2-polyprenyl-3-methyl-5-hydroxy-6-metoxy-1,4-benzoquinol methylase/dTDP-4-dehydrorhamnose reductase